MINSPRPQPARQTALEALPPCPITDLDFTAAPAATPAEPNRRAFVAIAAGLGAGAVTHFPSLVRRTALTAVSYSFEDEFDGPAGSAPDPSKWVYDVGGGGWGNNELEVYTSARANSFLDGAGHLVIRATKTTQVSGGQTTATYRSARLKTIGIFSQYQGMFEARIKLDVQSGLWPAWWAMGANFGQVGWPACGEVDLLENYGYSGAETSVHTPDDAGTGMLTTSADIAVDDEWHTWGMSWGAGAGFTFYKDGVNYMTVAPRQMANWCFSSGVPMFMLLNLAVGGAAGAPPDSTQFPVDLLVDYVRVC
jgi:beta-glucanase (GH16 family)